LQVDSELIRIAGVGDGRLREIQRSGLVYGDRV
jgi:hypothetical protein